MRHEKIALEEWGSVVEFCGADRAMLIGARYGWLCAVVAAGRLNSKSYDVLIDVRDGKLRCPDCNGTGRLHDPEGAPRGMCDCPAGKAEAKARKEQEDAAPAF